MKTKTAIIQALATFALLVPLAQAQNDGRGVPNSPTSVFHPAPPAGFDPVKASPADRARFGFPPMPNKASAKAYAHWLKVVTAPQTRVENPTAVGTNYTNNPAQGVVQTGVAGNQIYALSTNWSGYANYDPVNNPFAANDSYVFSEVTVPYINKENCQYAPFALSEWVGIDGFGSEDVLQTGIAVFGCPATTFVAWYEWFENGCPYSSNNQPCYETNVNLPVDPGDIIEEEVWYTTAAPNGHAYLLNVTKEKSISVSFYQPPGTAVFQGDSAEWILERPEFSSGLANLSNYQGAAMSDSYAYSYLEEEYYDPTEAPTGSIYNLTMVCPGWVPALECKYLTPLSYVSVFDGDNLSFLAAGPATQQ